MRALAAAFVAAAALAGMLFASRLPASPQFILPRRFGYLLFEAAWRLFSAPLGRLAFAAAAAGLLLASAALLSAALWRAAGRRLPSSWTGAAALGLGPLAAMALAWRLSNHLLDLVQSVWFPYGSLSPWELPLVFSGYALILGLAAVASTAWAEGRRRRASISMGVLIALDVSGALLAYSRGVGRPLEARTASGRTLFLVLTETEKGPGRDVYLLAPDVFAESDPRPDYERLASGRADARVLPALRALYEEHTKRWDLPGLRRALLLGVRRGDALAAPLLLSHLSAVPRSDEALAALGSLADEKAHRVGPLAAAAIARAYARFGEADAASAWALKAEGLPRGLLGLDEEPVLRSGRISGVLRGAVRARVALYIRRDPSAPYLLDASGLVASTRPDARGRFAFTGLPAGRYYLALALPEGPRGDISVLGHRGDILLDARRPARDLPALTIGSTSR